MPTNLAAEQTEAELARGRTRVAELEVELARRDGVVERAQAAASHERARAERLVTEERLALADRNEARVHVTGLEARATALEGERARLQLRLDAEVERARRAEAEAHERAERGKELRRALDEAERRVDELRRHVSGTERLRARAEALEAALRDESKRAGTIEDNLRAVAATLQKESD
jgi:hypothetical protein